MSEQEQEQFENEDLGNENQEQDEHRDDGQPETEQESESEGFDIVLDGEEPAKAEDDPYRGQPAPEWVKELRARDKENQKRIKELESQVAIQTKPKEIELGEKPTLDSVGYDPDELDRQLDEWYSKKAKFDQQQQAKQAEQEQLQQRWNNRLQAYEAKKTAVKSKAHDYDEAEEVVRDVLQENQIGILMHTENPQNIVLYLGRNPQKAKELSGISDPIEFALKLGKLEDKLTVQPRKPQTSPERKPSGSAPLNGVVDAKEAALEKEAEKTGDRTKLIQYRKSKKGK